jgi:hypothetical protein
MDTKKVAMTLLTAFILFLAPLAISAGNGAMQDTLARNQKLRVSEELRSTNGQYTLALQGDGNLVASDSQGRPIWSSNTAGSGAVECVLQGDGNLVLKTGSGKDVWATSTEGYKNARLMIQDDGNLVIYNERGLVVWAKGRIRDSLSGDENLLVNEFIRSQNRKYTLILQGDGNLVARDKQGKGIWNSNTVGSGVTECVLQSDGNLLLKDRNGKVVWATNTDGFSNARLLMQDDGLVVLYTESEKTIWVNGSLSPNIQRDTSPPAAQGVDRDSLSSYNANTGDYEFDNSLNNLNSVAHRDLDNFISQLSSTYDLSRPWIENLVKKESIPPADVYMIARTSRVTNRPIATVEKYYKDNRGQGWGVTAQRLGIKPGSPEFHALKKDDTGLLSKGKSQGQKKNDKDSNKEGKEK